MSTVQHRYVLCLRNHVSFDFVLIAKGYLMSAYLMVLIPSYVCKVHILKTTQASDSTATHRSNSWIMGGVICICFHDAAHIIISAYLDNGASILQASLLLYLIPIIPFLNGMWLGIDWIHAIVDFDYYSPFHWNSAVMSHINKDWWLQCKIIDVEL